MAFVEGCRATVLGCLKRMGNIGAWKVTYTIVVVPYNKYSIYIYIYTPKPYSNY